MQTENSGMTRILLAAMLCCLYPFNVKAQSDTLVYLNGDKVVGFLKEGTDDGVIFTLEVDGREVILNEKKSNIYMVKFENGQSLTYTDIRSKKAIKTYQNPNSPAKLRSEILQSDQKIRIIKLNSLSLPFQALTLGVEKMVLPGQHWDLNIGFINQHLSNEMTYGVYIKSGYKRFLVKNVLTNTEFLSNPHQGWYIKPEIVFGIMAVIKEDLRKEKSSDRGEERFVGSLVNIGYQISRPSGFIIDFHLGLGAGVRDNIGRPFYDFDSKIYSRVRSYGTLNFFEKLQANGMYDLGINIGYQF